MHSHIGHVGLLFAQSIVAASAILAAEITTAEGMIATLERLGLAIALVVFFVVTGWMREQRMAKRIDWLEKENDKTTNALAKLNEQVNTKVTSAIDKLAAAIDKLDGRMCYACASREEFEALRALIAAKRAAT